MDQSGRSGVDSGSSLPNGQHMMQKIALPKIPHWRRRQGPAQNPTVVSPASSVDAEKEVPPTEKWSLGILNDKHTDEVPGASVGPWYQCYDLTLAV
jgi:hypothetical protein